MTDPKKIGARIRALRKSMGLTQEELAGDHMTKSMLSQIENGRTFPSMRTLQYLATKLKQDPGYFLEEHGNESVRELLREVEQASKTKDYEKVLALITPKLESLPSTVDTARVLEHYIAACFYTGTEGGEEAVTKASDICERFGLYVDSVKIKYLRYALLFAREQYQESLNLIRSLQEEYASKRTSRDYLFEIQLYYAESISLSAVGRYAECRDVMLEALNLSKEEGVYHLTDHFYRILAQNCILTGETDKIWHYLKKARQFAEVTEVEESIGLVEHSEVRVMNWEGRYGEALQHAEHSLYFRKNDKEGYLLQTGISLYGLGRYADALEALSQIQTPRINAAHHPLDKIRRYTAYAYRANALVKLGRVVEAEEQALIAYERTRGYPSCPELELIQQTYQSLFT